VSDTPYREVFWDGARLGLHARDGARRLGIDRRCLEGQPISGCFASVCAGVPDTARLPFDQPEVQQARRDALAWWIPLLGDSLVCLSTLRLDGVYCAGAVTVATHPGHFDDDPFARLFAATVITTGLFSAVPAPAGPLIERTAGAPWPGGRFENHAA